MNNTPNRLSNNDNHCEGVIPTVVSFENDSDISDASLEHTSLEKKPTIMQINRQKWSIG